jgi:hypothetical protein
MDIHLFRLVAAHLSRFEQICVISIGRQDRPAVATPGSALKKNRAGPRPCSEKTQITKRYAELTPRISVVDRDGCGFAPACPPKTWTARSSALQVASPLDLATSTLADLPGLVTEK